MLSRDQQVNYKAVKSEARWIVPEISEQKPEKSEGLPLPCNSKHKRWQSVYVLKWSSRFQRLDKWQKQARSYEADDNTIRVKAL